MEKRRVMVSKLNGTQQYECPKCGHIVIVPKDERVSGCPVCGFDFLHIPQVTAQEFERQGA
jgi:DNA-directed RNA polymerase subunit RPC12/RpoP